MKRIYTFYFVVCMLFTLPCIAQPVLTVTNWAPAPGEIYTSFSADTAGITEGIAGANKTWDFSNLVINTTPVTIQYMAPSATPYDLLFPEATVSGFDGMHYNYYKTNTTEYTLLGTGCTSYIINYSDQQKYCQFPFSYPDSFTDNLAYSYVSGVEFTDTGSATTTADAWGKLILPSGTFNNVLRLKCLQVINDSSSYGPMIYTTESYWWTDGIHKNPLLSIVYFSMVMEGSTDYSKSVYVSSETSEIENFNEDNFSIGIAPNPASQRVAINFNFREPLNCDIKLLDATGRMVKLYNNCHFETGRNQKEIDVSDLKEGIYLLRVSTLNRSVYKKLIVN